MKMIGKFINTKILIFSLMVLLMFMFAACSSDDEDLNDENGDTLVTSIQVTSEDNATTISELAGTLQMHATVMPEDATDASYTWSVVNETGVASISPDGLLTAESNGTVIVTATSVSTPDVTGTKTITISQPEADMDATLTQLHVDGQSVLGFDPLVLTYVQLLSEGTTQTPVVTATEYDSTANVDIVDAADVTAEDIADRTTTITVTTTDDVQTIYKVVFESHIEAVDLGSAADFVILAESGVSTAPPSVITGDLGLSPVAATYFTGFSLTMHASGEYSLSDQVTGKLYAADYTSPTPSKLTTAVEDMKLAYDDAAGRDAHYTELYSGDLSGKTLTPGVFKFGTSVLINTDLTLKGSPTDVWIFQISGGLTMASNINIILEDGADAQNIFWQVSDTVTIGAGSHFEGIFLAKTNISMETNASINGHLYAQTSISLDAVTVTKVIE